MSEPRPCVEVLTIGDEILRGEIVDSNKARIATYLLRCDIEVERQISVADDPQLMTQVFSEAARRSDLVLISGGLGPTRDDLTTEILAQTFDRSLILHEPSFAAIRTRFEERHASKDVAVPESNKKQAYFPEGAEVLANPIGTAPGFRLEVGGTFFFCMPGVPRELDRMMEEQVLPWIEKQWPGRAVCRERRLRTFGIGESALEDALGKLEGLGEDLRLGFRTAFPDNFLRVVARASNLAEAEAQLGSICGKIRDLLGPLVYGEDEEGLEEVLSELLRSQRKTVATAESCTGGLVAELLTNLPGSSDIFLGGVVAYANSAKQDLLGISEELLEVHGAVSEPVARAMANAARERFGADYSLASTGIAGPGGGTAEKPVGTVCLAWAGPKNTRVESFCLPFPRALHRRLCTQVLYDGLRRELLGLPEGQLLPFAGSR